MCSTCAHVCACELMYGQVLHSLQIKLLILLTTLKSGILAAFPEEMASQTNNLKNVSIPLSLDSVMINSISTG